MADARVSLSTSTVLLWVLGVGAFVFVVTQFPRRAAGTPEPKYGPEGAVCNGLGWVWKIRDGQWYCTPRHWWEVIRP
jgi:hypothetical protein